MDCKVCDKKFTGIECYNQHVNSEKHRKKMGMHLQNNGTLNNTVPISSQASNGSLAVNINAFPCVICSKNFYSLPDFMKHSESVEHGSMVLFKNSSNLIDQQKETLCSSTTGDFSVNGCEVDHLISGSQLNKSSDLLNHSGTANSYYAMCKPCDKYFSGPGNYRDHIVSKGHKKKCGSLPPIESQGGDQKIIADSILASDVCDKTFNNSSSFQQPEVNIEHTRKMLAEASSIKVNSNENSSILMNNLICEICNMTFTGPIPHNEHLQSLPHKKGVERKQLLIQMGQGKENRETESVVDSVTKPAGKMFSRPWYCEVCDTICSGPEPYRAHMDSKKHKKNVAKAGADCKQNEIRNIMSKLPGEVAIFSSQKSTTADFSMMEDNTARFLNVKSDPESKDSSMSENSTSFCAIDVAHLNMTFFKVGEAIDFDKNEKTVINVSQLEEDGMDYDEDNEETTYEDMPSP